MSQAIYPTLTGLMFPVGRAPIFKTNVDESASGREFRSALRVYPRIKYTLRYEFMRDIASAGEFRTLLGFFNARQGSYDSFLFLDPDDNTVTAQTFGPADGTGYSYQLVRTLGGYVEPVYDPLSTISVYKNDGTWRGNELQYKTSRTNLFLQSNHQENASWVKTNTTAALNQTGIDGTASSACLITATNATNATISQSGGSGLANSTQHTRSMIAKAGTTNNLIFETGDNGAYTSTIFNLSTNAISGTRTTGASVVDLGGGWKRCILTWTTGATGTQNGHVFYIDAYGAATGAFTLTAQHAQLEYGSAVTPPIITTTVLVTTTDISISNGLVTWSILPLPGSLLTWTGQFYWRCRFMSDQADFEKFMNTFWQLGKVEFIVTKP